MSQSSASKYYYYEESGVKQGPLTFMQIRDQIKGKFIVANTIIEYDNKRIRAKEFIKQFSNTSAAPNSTEQHPIDQTTANSSAQPTLYYIIDSNNTKSNSTYNLMQLQRLADQREITQDTQMEVTGYGRAPASQIPGLHFPESMSMPIESNETKVNERTNTPTKTIGSKESTRYFQLKKQPFLGWLLDLSFKNVIILEFIAFIIKLIYVLFIIIGVLFFVSITVSFNEVEFLETGFIKKIFLFFLLWLLFPIYLIILKLFCEYLLVFVRWMSVTMKASEIYIRKNSDNQN